MNAMTIEEKLAIAEAANRGLVAENDRLRKHLDKLRERVVAARAELEDVAESTWCEWNIREVKAEVSNG